MGEALARGVERAAQGLESELGGVADGDWEAMRRGAAERDAFRRMFPERSAVLEALEEGWFERSREGLLSEWGGREAAGAGEAAGWLACFEHPRRRRLYQAIFAATRAEALDLARRGAFDGARRRAERFAAVLGGREWVGPGDRSVETFVEGYRFLAELAARAGRSGPEGGGR